MKNLQVLCYPVGPMGTNCYILFNDGNEKALIVDPGGNFSYLQKRLNAINKKAGAVLLTHGHFDHVMAANDFQNAGAFIYLHEKDVELVNSEDNLAMAFLRLEIPAVRVDNRLIEGDFEICGFKVSVIETPGHTSGSVCYKIGNMLFTGDCILKSSYGRVDFPSGCESDMIRSAKKLFALEEDLIIYPGHDYPTTLKVEKDNNPIRRLF